ncbi:xanthine dehydrogenase family protein molybdopterin-binding subunit [Sphingomonas quercus]|uniref:Molybdopterin-dependent oxidoreductase n=1 Tax=Sphingomonas quercus TaxID=2842451 RepID=A0ABS6BN65_9SPHN|nr:molybdopterin cofactor-binding domain-containing protein [Sphingomonas quercus]MBU3079241.1 molybdopterin-dependent oxidoreductase [Sphingomonas quercus]
MATSIDTSRRGFLKVSAAAGGGLLLGFELLQDGAEAASAFAPNAFIRIDPKGIVTLIMPQQEMGQGTHTGHSQLLAEELDVAMSQVVLEQAPPNDMLYGGPKAPPERRRQSTGGSSSFRNGFYISLRQAGANARAILVTAAARLWKVDPATLRTSDGVVYHDPSGRQIGYGELSPRAGAITLPTDAPLKADKDFKLIGKPVHRLDVPAKTNGSVTYGIDVMAGKVPVAAVLQAPVVGGKVAAVDDAAARAIPGVKQIVVLDDLVAVVADNTWLAFKGLKALGVTWNDGPNGRLGQADIVRDLREKTSKPGVSAKNEGDIDKAFGSGDRIDVAYEMPFLAHSPMEPLNCTVHVQGKTAEIWVGTQVQTGAQKAAAKVLDVDPKAVTLTNFMLGGGFGRRLDTDMVTNAVRVAQQVSGPVKVMWSREEDTRHDTVRPYYRNVMAATLKDGRIDAWLHRISGGSVPVRMSGKPPKDGLDGSTIDGADEIPYEIPNLRVEYVQCEPGAVNVGWWRGVGPNNSLFAVESLIDELARKAGKDPLEFRLAHLQKSPRAAGVLRLAADKAGWSGPLEGKAGRGIAMINAFGSFCAAVCEAEVNADGDVRVRRMVVAVDAGKVVNPDGITSQVEGGVVFALTSAFWGNITVANGRIQQSNFHDYRMMRIHEAPPVEVHIVPSNEDPGGIGEPGVTVSTPALVNAIAAATGIRLRTMPIDREILAGRKDNA